jgi:hypothetical protein
MKAQRFGMNIRGTLVFAAALLLAAMTSGCRQATPTVAPVNRSGPVLTPASLNVVVGTPVAALSVSNEWPAVQYPALGVSLQVPPTWKAVALDMGSGLGLYPPGSNPAMPTPAIAVEWLNTPYAGNRTQRATGSAVNAKTVSGIAGQQYQDTRFAVPLQSSYIELPYRGGTLMIITTIGPSIDLTPQLAEILKTVILAQ